MLLEFALIAGAVASYIGMVVITFRTGNKVFGSRGQWDCGGDVFGSLLWPVGLPVVLFFATGKVSKQARQKLATKARRREDKLLMPGVERPSYLLAQLVAARIVQYPENLGNSGYFDDKLQLQSSYDNFKVTVAGKHFLIPNEFSYVIDEAIAKARKINDEMSVLRKKTEKEQEAVNLLEALTVEKDET